MAPMHSFSVTYAIVLRLVQKDGLIATNSRIVGGKLGFESGGLSGGHCLSTVGEVAGASSPSACGSDQEMVARSAPTPVPRTKP